MESLEEMAEKEEVNCYYFIAKCTNIPSLRKCTESGVWACKDRTNSTEQPETILSKALEKGNVILILSVNNCHGWHGYCQMLEKPGSHEPKENEEGEITQWKHFQVEWKCCFLKEFGERCVPFTSTNYVLSDKTHISKSRNWQEIPCVIGRSVCEEIDNLYKELVNKRQKAKKEKLAQVPAPFIKSDIAQIENVKEYWESIVKKVEKELGKVHLACPFGSQRYNLDGPGSDIDVFIVYQAKTSAILGFNPPKQTIKNTEEERCDYTILEIHRYCELLSSGDPRCVETLYLHPTTIIHTSPQWRNLTELAPLMLTRQCLDKYLRDAQGSNGVKQLRRWLEENTGKPLPLRIYKLCYIIIRLMQNARDVVNGGPIRVYREEGSSERDILIATRRCEPSREDVWSTIQSLQEEIDEKKGNLPTESGINEVEQWLLQQRFSDLKEN